MSIRPYCEMHWQHWPKVLSLCLAASPEIVLRNLLMSGAKSSARQCVLLIVTDGIRHKFDGAQIDAVIDLLNVVNAGPEHNSILRTCQ